MSPEEYCQNKTTQSGSSFYYSFLYLPPDKRKAITALYAFCREVDDVVDEYTDIDIARKKLDWWSAELERCFQDNPQHPVSHALQEPLLRFNLQQAYFSEIIDGMRMDLEQFQYTSFSELGLYCYRVAGVVGLLSAEIFGYRNRHTLDYAEHLGTAFQLTNILRDVREDALRGRVYIPTDELHQFGLEPQDILTNPVRKNLQPLFRQQAERGRKYYRKAMELLPLEDRYAQRAGLIMAKIYQTLLDEIETDNFSVMEQRIHLTPLRKFWIAWSTARREKRQFNRSVKSTVTL